MRPRQRCSASRRESWDAGALPYLECTYLLAVLTYLLGGALEAISVTSPYLLVVYLVVYISVIVSSADARVLPVQVRYDYLPNKLEVRTP